MHKFLLLLAFLTLCVVPVGVQAAVVNINTASTAELETLPGIGPAKAAAIISYRTNQGPFVHIEDIQNVKGIGPSTFAHIQPLITVSARAATPQPKSPPPSSPIEQTRSAPPPEGRESSSTSTNSARPHDNADIGAPTVPNKGGIVGAALPLSGRSTDVLHSPWTLGLLGVLVIAGAALLIL